MMSVKVIARKRSKEIAEIILNRTAKRNAIDFDSMKLLSNYLGEFKEDKAITMLLIRGEGDVFCGGGDLSSFHNLYTEEEALSMLKPMSDVLKAIAVFPAMTLTYLNGTAVGGGAELASATDYRFAGEAGEIGYIQGNLHITTGWGGGALLKKRVGYETAMRMLGTGTRYTMAEAHKLGYVNKIVNGLEEIDEWAAKWLDPVIIRQYKRLLLSEEERGSLFSSIDKEVKACAKLWAKKEHHDAVQSFLNRQK